MEKLLVVIAIAFLWLYRIGQYCHQQKPIKLKTHQRLAQSLFRYGLEALIHAFEFDSQRVTRFIQLLSCT